jgi:hypothetical protein
VLLLCLAWAPARADIVLHDGGVNKDRDAGERVKERTGAAPSLVLSNDVLSGPTRVLTGNATVEQCEGAPIPLAVDKKLDEIEEDVFSYELESAIRSLDILSTLMPCASTPIPAAALARTSFLRGATLLDMGEPLAEKAMAEALAFVPDYTGERGFPRAHAEMLKTARRRMESLPDGRLFIWAGPGGEAVFIDGTERQQEDSVGVAVRPGLHLVQVVKDGTMKGMWIRIRSRFSAVIFPGAGRGIWADGGRSPGGEQAISLLLASEFRGQQGDIHILHYRGRLISASTWPAYGEGHKRWQLKTRGSDRRKAKHRNRSKRAKPEQVAVEAAPPTTAQDAERPAQQAGRTTPRRGSAAEPEASEVRPKSDASPETVTEPAGKAETKASAEPAGKAETKASAEPAGKAETKASAEPAGKAETKASAEPAGKAETKASAEPAGKAETKADAKPAGGPAAKTDGKPVAEAEPQGKARPWRGTGPRRKTSPPTRARPRTRARPPIEAEPGPPPGSETSPSTATDVQTSPYAKRRFRFVLGGGYHYADPFSYAVIALDVSFQFFGPLHAAVFLRPSLGKIAEFPVADGAEPIRGPLSFVPVGLGVGVQRPGRFAPYARIVGQYAHNRDRLSEPEHLGGVMIQGGLDVTPRPKLPLIVRVQAEAGFLGAHFNARIWGGVGLNL